MPRYRLTHLLMGTALVAILVVLTQSEGCGLPHYMIECVSFSPDGSQIAVARLDARDAQTPMKAYKSDVSRTVSLLGSSNGASAGVVHQDLKPGNCGPAFGLWRVGRTSAVFNPINGRIVAHDFGGGDVRQYDPRHASEPLVARLRHRAWNIAVSRCGRFVAASGYEELTIVDTATNKPVMRGQVEEYPFLSASMLGFTADETRIVAAGYREIRVWEIATGARTSTITPGFASPILAIAVAPDDTLLVCSGEGACRYDLSGNCVAKLTNADLCKACSVSANGQYAALVADRKRLEIYDLRSGEKTGSVRFLCSPTSLAFSPDSNSLAVGDACGTVSLFDPRTRTRLWTATPPGRYRWPWTMPAFFLLVWAFVAWRLEKRAAVR